MVEDGDKVTQLGYGIYIPYIPPCEIDEEYGNVYLDMQRDVSKLLEKYYPKYMAEIRRSNCNRILECPFMDLNEVRKYFY